MNLYNNIAEFYDLEDEEFQQDDLDFYKSFVKNKKCKVLELGCGTGRVAIYLANHGYKVTGIDLSKEMLMQFQNKIERHNNLKKCVRIVYGDISNFDLNEQFDLIIAPGRVFQALTDNDSIINSLECIKKHLSIKGVLILDFFQPKTFLDEKYCFNEITVYSKIINNYIISMKYKCNQIDRKQKLVYSTNLIEKKSLDGFEQTYVEKNILKYYSSQEVKDLLINNGFIIENEFGWFNKSPIDNNREMIYVVKKSI